MASATTDSVQKAEKVVEECKAQNQRVSENLAKPALSPEEITMTTQPPPPAAPAAAPVAPAAPEKEAAGFKSKWNSLKASLKENKIVNIPYWDFIIIVLLFLVFYLSLGLLCFALTEIAVTLRGSDYHSLPSVYYGDFSRDFYYKGYGAPVDKQIELLPWVKAAVCPDNLNNYVCTPDCDDLFVTPPKGVSDGSIIPNDECNARADCGSARCYNP